MPLVVYITILLTLLFLYCALRALVKCKRLTNIILYYITAASSPAAIRPYIHFYAVEQVGYGKIN